MNLLNFPKTLLVLVSLISLNSLTLAQKDLVCQLIEINFYECEIHKILTSDNYVLTLHRIKPLTRTNNIFHSCPNNSSFKRPIILMHGLIGSAADFLLLGKNRAISSVLYEQGYDVWLPNARGTTFSKNHKDYDSSQPIFWNFTWHEIGVMDLPAIVDYILDFTKNPSLHYIAHSQGSTILFVMLSEKPEYNDKIATAHLLAPVAFLNDLQSPPLRLMAQESEKVEALLNHLGLHELFPSTALNQLGGHLLCGKGVPTQNLCLLLLFLTVGFSDFQMDRHLFPRIFETTPAGISRKQFQHFGQLITSGKFQQFDYKSKSENFQRYKRKTPPEYNLRHVRVPLQLFYGNRDLLMAKQDVFRLTAKLKNTHYSLNEIPGFNHIDLLYATAAPRLIYRSILRDIQKYYK